MARRMVSDTSKKVPLSKDALNMLEEKRKSPDESYSDILIRVLKSSAPANAKKEMHMSDAGFQSLVRREIEEARQMGKDYYEGGEW